MGIVDVGILETNLGLRRCEKTASKILLRDNGPSTYSLKITFSGQR